ncbi:MAG: hypothetical protein ACR2JF_17030 [Iamia sp.]
MTAVVVALGLVVAVLMLLVLGLLRSHADILRRLHQLDGGAEGTDGGAGPRTVRRDEFTTFPEVQAPPEREGFTESRDLSGVGVGDDALTVRVTGVEHRTLVAFLSGTCLTCQRFWDAFQKPAKLGLPGDVRPVIVTKGPDQESAAKVADLAPSKVPVLMSNDAWLSYDVPGSPYFVLVDGRSGKVQGEGTGIDWNQVKGLLTQVTDDDSYAAELDQRRVGKYRADDERERRVDDELLAAGITPGDPSLYGPAAEEDHDHPDDDG